MAHGSLALGLPTTCCRTLRQHTDEVWYVSFSHDGTKLASASRDCTAVVWSVPAFEVLLTLRGHTEGMLEPLGAKV